MCCSRTVGSIRPTPPFQPDSVPPGATGPGAICIPGKCHRSFAELLPREQLFGGIAPSGKRGLTVFRPLVLRWRARRGRRRACVRARDRCRSANRSPSFCHRDAGSSPG